MPSYNLFGQATETWSATGSNQGTAGVEFSVNQPGVLNGIWLYSPSGQGLTSTPTQIALYTVSGTTLVSSQTPTWSATFGTGWIYAAFSSPLALTAGTQYMAVVFGAAASFGFNSSYTWPTSSGPLTGINGGYYNTGSSLAYPSSQQTGWNWYVDVEVTVAGQVQPGKHYRPPGRKSRTGKSLGSPLSFPSGSPSSFTAPRASRGKANVKHSRSSRSPGAPLYFLPAGGGYFLTEGGGRLLNDAGGLLKIQGGVTPSPFTIPGKTTRGKTAASKSRTSAVHASPVITPATPSAFSAPAKAVKGKPAAARSRQGSSPGAPLSFASPFHVPVKAARGDTAARKSRSQAGSGSPVILSPVPSPFAVPGHVNRGHTAAKRSKVGSSLGAPVTLPSPQSSPFSVPGKVQRGKSAAGKSRTRVSPGSTPQVPASAFSLPEKITRGKPANHRSRVGSSPGSPVTVVLTPSPFNPPAHVIRGKVSAGKSRTSESSGTRASYQSPFSAPENITRGKQGAARARWAASAGAPVIPPVPVPSPFTPPEESHGKPVARRSKHASSPGSPVVPPVPSPSPFEVPVKDQRGRPATRKSRAHKSSGSPVSVPVTPSPFSVPRKTVKGKPAVRKTRHAKHSGSKFSVIASSLFSQASESGLTTGVSAGTVGLVFDSSSAGYIDGIWLFSAPGFTSLPTQIGLYSESTQSLIASNTSPNWSAGPGTGWIYAAFTSPVAVTATTLYTAAVYGAAGSFGYTVSYGWPVTNAPLTAQSSQGWYSPASGSLSYPSSQQTGWNWYVDVAFTPGNVSVPLALASVSTSAKPAGVSPVVPLAHASASVTAYPVTAVDTYGAILAVAGVTTTALPVIPVYPGTAALAAAHVAVTAHPLTLAPDFYVPLARASASVTAHPLTFVPPTTVALQAAQVNVTAYPVHPPNPLSMSIAPLAGTDEFGNSYEAGFHVYGSGAFAGTRASMSSVGDLPSVTFTPGEFSGTSGYVTASAYGIGVGSGTAQQSVQIHDSGAFTGKDSAGVWSYSESSDGTQPSQVIVVIGGNQMLIVTKTGGQAWAQNPSGGMVEAFSWDYEGIHNLP